MTSFEQYNRVEEEHVEMAVLFHDTVEEFRESNKLSKEQMKTLLNDSIKQYKYEEQEMQKYVCGCGKQITPHDYIYDGKCDECRAKGDKK